MLYISNNIIKAIMKCWHWTGSILCFIILINNAIPVFGDWESWWTYEGISGPGFWGKLNPRWSHCAKGRRQSPIDIDTTRIIYDPHLGELQITSSSDISGNLTNTGRSVSLILGSLFGQPPILSGGPLSYQYQVSNITLHYGSESGRGSEHTIDSRAFPAELQFLAFNTLYANFSEALKSSHGLAGVSVFVKLTKNSSLVTSSGAGLRIFTDNIKDISRRGQNREVGPISLVSLLPSHRQYVTYDGSLTEPACYETVEWIVLNRPLYATPSQLQTLRSALNDNPPDNFRPVQPLNSRLIRSNIIAQSDHRFQRLSNDDSENSADYNDKPFGANTCFVNRPVAYELKKQDFDLESVY